MKFAVWLWKRLWRRFGVRIPWHKESLAWKPHPLPFEVWSRAKPRRPSKRMCLIPRNWWIHQRIPIPMFTSSALLPREVAAYGIWNWCGAFFTLSDCSHATDCSFSTLNVILLEKGIHLLQSVPYSCHIRTKHQKPWPQWFVRLISAHYQCILLLYASYVPTAIAE